MSDLVSGVTQAGPSDELTLKHNVDLSVRSMEGVFNPLHEQLTCTLCKWVFTTRMKDVVTQWASVKVCAIVIFNLVTDLQTYNLAHDMNISSTVLFRCIP